ncbi:hypothetical protein SAMN04488511_101234 [Pedobacter suwonensis]|uniref:Uncharacterized protein n=1 Tax=Pedobacter suwonensis TaxID=332999 RepID=A0A1I0SGD5_9SPHI|nr:hypothetical protein SAMN04488511_101234 [Pedobacter suwonensis]
MKIAAAKHTDIWQIIQLFKHLNWTLSLILAGNYYDILYIGLIDFISLIKY